ncbi:hypothetical protein DL546_004372 [Coniochaeta pulveracea]|uniref:Uncharacterized protein n=1 Tax=Coniochaeta pulveracea TaxID=177199 RepID=A0A420Y1M6_9PEZI|nr:hypothetical protein DL546_004372 [Coniochaeta pulveracea]
MRQGTLEEQRTAKETVLFENIDGFDVPEARLFNPPEGAISAEEIAKAKAGRLAHGDAVPPRPVENAIAAGACVPAYCSGPNYDL